MTNRVAPRDLKTARRVDGTRRRRGALRFTLAVVAGFCLAGASYAMVAFLCAVLPADGRAMGETTGEPPVYVCASLAHADVILPLHDPLQNWEMMFPEVAPARLPQEVMLAIGWGDLNFFRNTPTWADVRFSTAARALLGQGTSALRVVAVNPPKQTPGCLRLKIDRGGRQALIDQVRKSLLLGADGKPQRQAGGEGFEAYYLAQGRYGPFNTCNQWASQELGAAGLPHAWFAPFSFGVMWPLEAVAQKD